MAFWKNFASGLVASLGIEHNTTTHLDKLISALGALLGILTVYWVSQWYLHTEGMLLMVASMGASAVPLFAVPHGALSQPWPVLGGHLLSSILGGEQIHAMGYDYLPTSILLNVLAILLLAFLYNGLFPWRRYPAHIVTLTAICRRVRYRHLPHRRIPGVGAFRGGPSQRSVGAARTVQTLMPATPVTGSIPFRWSTGRGIPAVPLPVQARRRCDRSDRPGA